MSGRLMKEYRELQKEASSPDSEIQLAPVDGNLNNWRGFVHGPDSTPFAKGHFELEIIVPSSYPLAPPNIRFATKIFHPNVHPKTGEICLDILKNAWSPAWTLQATCRAIIILLSNPEPESPLNCDAGNLLRNGDTRGFRSLATMYTLLHAGNATPASSSSSQPVVRSR
jgi:peroxin-4